MHGRQGGEGESLGLTSLTLSLSAEGRGDHSPLGVTAGRRAAPLRPVISHLTVSASSTRFTILLSLVSSRRPDSEVETEFGDATLTWSVEADAVTLCCEYDAKIGTHSHINAINLSMYGGRRQQVTTRSTAGQVRCRTTRAMVCQ